MRSDMKGQAGAVGDLLAFIGNVLTAGISLTPPCRGVVTTVSVLGLLGLGAGVVIRPRRFNSPLVQYLRSASYVHRCAHKSPASRNVPTTKGTPARVPFNRDPPT
jgi:hypothetical protein